MIDINNFDAIEISLASSKQIRSWSSGEVIKPETINYRTLKPEKDGLFCERIFGPTKDWECYCGKYKRVRYKGIVCERCGVEVTRSKVRRERMGHVDLAAPVSHIWFFKGVPSRIGYLLDMAPKELEKVLYFAASIVTWVDEEAREKDLNKLEKEVNKVLDSYEGEREERVQELQESLERRVAYLETGKETGFSDDDSLWAEALDINIKKLSDEDREKLTKDIRKVFESDISDTEAYIEDAAERMRQVWDLFREMKPKEVIADETVFRELKDRFGSPYGFGEYFRGGMGAEAVRDLLEQVDLDAERLDLEDQVKTAKGQKQSRPVKRLKVVSAFIHSDNKPEHMVLEAIPVIPPELRPMVQLDGGRFATSDLNDLYRRVINRNNRLKRLLDLGAPEIIVNNEKRMLQEAVDALFDNGRRGRAVTGPGNRPLKSLSDMLKGKQGRFRQTLLGKRVAYSGRSVIVVGPELKLHQCGLPKAMAVELFKPFIIHKLVEKGIAETVKRAKKIVEKESPEVYEILEEIIQDHPVLLNRAPTLHRLGIQAFEPVLVEGKAIRIHPLVCAAFNADFDGDQMAVHVPLSFEAQLESRLLMISSNNILKPSDGRPVAEPSQDMVLGCHFLTKEPADFEEQLKTAPRIGSMAELEMGLAIKRLEFHSPVQMWHERPTLAGRWIATTAGRVIFNSIVPVGLLRELGFQNKVMRKKDLSELVFESYRRAGLAPTVQFLDQLKEFGFRYATIGGVSIGVADLEIPTEKAPLLHDAEARVERFQRAYATGQITFGERYNKVIDAWTHANNDIAEAMVSTMRKSKGGFNPVFLMFDSGSRGSRDQIRQLAGMRGLMAKPQKKLTGGIGEIIESPIKSNFREGLSVLEYFISTHGARKGLADTALKTADAGYLTRRLVDVAQDVTITEEDCGTILGLEMSALKEGEDIIEPLRERIVGCVALEEVMDPHELDEDSRPKVLVEAGKLITEETSQAIEDAGIETVKIRSVLTCEAKRGVCRMCYGRNLATMDMVDLGEAVGILAAQSIGEPGTQLTLRTFHIGGTAARIAEQTVRKTKVEGVIEFGDRLTFVETPEKQKIVTSYEGELILKAPSHGETGGKLSVHSRFHVPLGATLMVVDGAKVGRDSVLFTWDPYTNPIMTDVGGVVRFVDIVEEETVREELDELTGRRQRVIIEDREKKLHPP